MTLFILNIFDLLIILSSFLAIYSILPAFYILIEKTGLAQKNKSSHHFNKPIELYYIIFYILFTAIYFQLKQNFTNYPSILGPYQNSNIDVELENDSINKEVN